MRKYFLTGGLALVLALGACGNEEPEVNSEDATSEEAESSEGAEDVSADSGADDSNAENESLKDRITELEEENEALKAQVENTAAESEVEEDTEDSGEDATAGEEETKTFVLEQDGMVNELVYYYVGDEVLRQTSETELTYEALGVADEEEARAELEAMGDDYNEVEGVTQNIEYGEDGIFETLEVDYTVADIGSVTELEEGSFEEGAENADFISMSRSEEQLLEEGYELVEGSGSADDEPAEGEDEASEGTSSGGGTRSNPLAFGETVELEFMFYGDDYDEDFSGTGELTVDDIIRGDEAYNMLMEENPYNEPAPDGYEWALIHSTFDFIESETDDHSYYVMDNFEIIEGDGSPAPTESAVTPDEFGYDELYAGGSSSGYSAVLVPEDGDFLIRYDDLIYNSIFFEAE